MGGGGGKTGRQTGRKHNTHTAESKQNTRVVQLFKNIQNKRKLFKALTAFITDGLLSRKADTYTSFVSW